MQIDKDQLTKAVDITGRLASTRTTLPILQNIHLQASKDQLVIKSTDLEQTVEVKVKVATEENWALTIPARLLADYLHNVSHQTVELEFEDTKLRLKAGSSKASLTGAPAEDYPHLPEVNAQLKTQINGLILKAALGRTVFACGVSETQPVLTAQLWRFTDKSLLLVSTDGYRLAKLSLPISEPLSGDFLLPRRALMELDRLLTDELVSIEFGSNQAKFTFGHVSFISRILEGKFPPFESRLEAKATQQFSLDTTKLVEALKLASVFSRDSAFSVRGELEGSKLKISAVSASLGDNTNEVDLGSEVKEPLAISFNAQYLLDGLGALNNPIELGLTDPNKPITLTSPSDAQAQDFLYLLMPLRSQ